MTKRGRIIAAVIGLVIVAGVVAAVALRSQGTGPEVETAVVTQQELAVTVTASGRIDSGVRADIYPPAQGTIEEVLVSDGETVTAGTEIARMDTTPFELQVAQARAGLSQAQAQLAAVNAQAPGQADLDAAQANVDATYKAYRAAKVQAASVSTQGPSQAQLEAARASTAAAWAGYQEASRGYTIAVSFSPAPSSDATVAAAAAARDQAYAAYLGARANEQQLRSTDLAAAQAQANAGVQQAYAAWKGAQAQLEQLRSGDVASQRLAAEAGVAQASEALSVAEQALEDATFTAPIDGIVVFNSPAAAAAAAAAAGGGASAGGGSEIGEGSAVSPASAPFSVIDLDALKFTAEVDEVDISRVEDGMAADVMLDAFPGEVFESEVIRVNPVAQPTATGGTIFEVELQMNRAGENILIGMKGDADIEVSSREGALTIPVEALFSEGGTDYVYVVENDRLRRTEITVGATTDTEVEVIEGLESGQRVALSGATQYTDGMQVRATR